MNVVVIQACDNVDYEESDWICYASTRPLETIRKELTLINDELRDLHRKAWDFHMARCQDDNYLSAMEDSTPGRKYLAVLKRARVYSKDRTNIYIGSNPISMFAQDVEIL